MITPLLSQFTQWGLVLIHRTSVGEIAQIEAAHDFGPAQSLECPSKQYRVRRRDLMFKEMRMLLEYDEVQMESVNPYHDDGQALGSGVSQAKPK